MDNSFSKIISDVYRFNDETTPDNLNNRLKKIALNSERKQSRICLHKSDDSLIQLMYICHLKDCKVRVHKHTDHPEWLIFLKAKAEIIYYDKKGKKTNRIFIDTKKSNGSKIHFIPIEIFHNMEYQEDSFFIEVKQGPFNKTAMHYLD